ncbi:DUF1937 family protein [Pararhodobacter sp. CCB-MM2]|uniref:DUF1937 family protein n=1 Tax=Pararhodobacter sp. CCB-MM2 TaxID=1786003 RepID=UPI0008298CB7|nr:DUF1937 family protein [Pararhodobacter sp. CCB-MM2]
MSLHQQDLSGTPVPLPPLKRIEWEPILAPKGVWSALVTPGSSPDRVHRHAAGMVYLSTPYQLEAQIRGAWHIDASVRASTLASVEVARLAAAGVTAIAPSVMRAEVAHARVLVEDAPEPLDAAYWAEWSMPILRLARLLVIPAIAGWDRCPLVWRDLRHALAHNVPVHVYGETA